MSAALTALLLAATPVRAEPVEALPFLEEQSSASTSSARTEGTRQAETAVDAERDFAAAARTEGQWTAFRRFAAPDALMFTPQAVKAQTFLKDLKDPPRSVEWSPTDSFVSCDGRLAANTGPWKRPDGSVGYFTTIWQRQADGSWRWLLDHGDRLDKSRPAVVYPRVRVATCGGAPQVEGLMIDGSSEFGASPDQTLFWHWAVTSGGSRHVSVGLWDGKRFQLVIDDDVPAAKP